MSATDDVRLYIRGSLTDLRRKLDVETAREIAHAVLLGASQALKDLSEAAEQDDPSGAGLSRDDALAFLSLAMPKH